MNMKLTIKISGALILAIAVVFTCSCDRKKETDELKRSIATAKAERKDISKEVMLTGSIEAKDYAEIFPRGPGKVVKKLLKDGDPVKKNQPILLTLRDEVGFTFKPAPVVSTINGFVGRVTVDVGESVDANTKVATVVGPDQMRIKIDMPENYLKEIEIGKRIPFGIEMLPDEVFEGEIASVSKDIDIVSRSARVELIVDNPDQKLVHGMFAKFEIPMETRKNSLTVPISAVSWEADKQYAYKLEGGRVKKVEVSTGLRNTTRVEIVSGLEDGDIVAVEGLIGLKEGEGVEAK